MLVLDRSELTRHSTEAARAYVLATRARLRAERARNGEAARDRRSYQRLERSISAAALAQVWPHAELRGIADDLADDLVE